MSNCCYKFSTNQYFYLPRAQSDHTDGVSIRAFLHLPHKLGQLGVCPTAVVDLKITEFYDRPLLLLYHIKSSPIYSLVSQHFHTTDYLCILFHIKNFI